MGPSPSAPDAYVTIAPDPPRSPSQLRLVPQPDGHVFVCLPDLYRFEPGYQCADATAAIEGETVAFDLFIPFVGEYRNDWQAMCVMRRPDWWQCWGTHEGWGRE